MSRETEKLLKLLEKELDKHDFQTDEELQSFLDVMNREGFEKLGLSTDSVDEAFEEYEIGCDLMDSDDPKDIKEALKHLQKAIELDPPFVDAQAEMLEAEREVAVYIRKLRELEEAAEDICLKDGEVEHEDVFGHAWRTIEMRPFLRIKKRLADAYLDQGMFRLAQEKYEDILAWNDNDNQGCRYLLIGIYAYFEEKEKAMELYDHYEQEQNAWSLISLAALHHKVGESEASLRYLKQLTKQIPESATFIANAILDLGLNEDFEPQYPGSYRPGTGEEMALAMDQLDFLLTSSRAFFMDLVSHCIEEYEKKAKKPRTAGKAKAKPKQK
ncbi:MAG: hypothetical protein LBG81_07725 [Coriobacteriaceae bacterium]|jgi:tetratricopeptide (TPR) repeat protein|nr:hypothetical protein [Coriobacteriaceae bacterium]